MKEGFVTKSGSPEPDEMKLINAYTRRVYGADEVYSFSLTLCDNEIDRDLERFSVESLKKLGELFIGKTCIFDHERKSFNQTARIFSTAIETDPTRKTRAGESYTRLTARAYLPRTPKNSEIIELIDSGILKEVSVSCAVKRSVCSVCGKEKCEHKKGREYSGRICCRVLEDPVDAYECSFVAVPAQREAGVTKALKMPDMSDVITRVKSAGNDAMFLTAADTVSLKAYIEELEEKAVNGDEYRKELTERLLKHLRLAEPDSPRSLLKGVIENLSVKELKELSDYYFKKASLVYPVAPQLAPPPAQTSADSNTAYRI